MDDDFQASSTTAIERRKAFLEKLSPELSEREDDIAQVTANHHGSSKSKLRKIYLLLNEISEVRAPFVACGKGCAQCCNVNITVSKVEAKAISENTGWKLNTVSETKKHKLDKYLGVPCPFLENDACSIYENRPMVCRTHASFFTSPKWCDTKVCLEIEAPLVNFAGIHQAYAAISDSQATIPVMADIRDFFDGNKARK
jgi:uncharacterized protein